MSRLTGPTQSTLLELAQETARLQLLSLRDRELIEQIKAAFPTMTEEEVIEDLKLWGGL